jgi:hypothetical protein
VCADHGRADAREHHAVRRIEPPDLFEQPMVARSSGGSSRSRRRGASRMSAKRCPLPSPPWRSRSSAVIRSRLRPASRHPGAHQGEPEEIEEVKSSRMASCFGPRSAVPSRPRSGPASGPDLLLVLNRPAACSHSRRTWKPSFRPRTSSARTSLLRSGPPEARKSWVRSCERRRSSARAAHPAAARGRRWRGAWGRAAPLERVARRAEGDPFGALGAASWLMPERYPPVEGPSISAMTDALAGVRAEVGGASRL